jgi:hypothetical protein
LVAAVLVVCAWRREVSRIVVSSRRAQVRARDGANDEHCHALQGVAWVRQDEATQDFWPDVSA